MLLRLILGRTGSGKTHQCLEEIRAQLRQAPEGAPLVLILPEHATFQTELALANTPGLHGFSRAAVFGFRRLAHRVLLETGGAIRPQINELGKKLLLGKLLRDNRQQLKALGRAANQRDFTETLAGMIREFKTYAITPGLLAQAAGAFDHPPLQDKLQDLALLYQQFNGLLAGKYTDPEDCLSLFADKIPQSALLTAADVWIDGFSWFNPQETAILSRVMAAAASVTVTLCLADTGSSRHALETALFHRQWNTWRKLKALAQSQGIAVEEFELTAARRFVHAPLLKHVEQNFFSFPPKTFSGDKQCLTIVEAANRRVEIEGVAADIVRLCREEGYRWRDTAILLRDTTAYSDLAAAVLAEYDIPFFSDGKRQPVHHPLAELIRSALESIANWSYEPLFRCFKTDFFPLTRDQIDDLENYVLEFGIRGSRWTGNEPWTFVRRLTLGENEEINAGQQQYLDDINEIKAIAIRPLLAFSRQVKAAGNVTGLTTALYQLLEALKAPEKLEEWAFSAEREGDLAQAREHRQIWESIIKLLEQLVETCGSQELSLNEFAAMVSDGLEGLKLSLIPPGLDYVTVSALEQNSISNVKAVYLLGVNDGVLPKRGRGEGLLTDDERSIIAGAGLELAPGAAADHFAERFLVYTALTRSTHYLWVSYPLADDEGKGLNPSIVVKRLKELAGITKLKSLPLEPAPGREQELLSHPRRALAGLAVALRQYKHGQEISPVWWDVYNWALQQGPYRRQLSQAVAGLFHANTAGSLPVELARRLYAGNKRLRGSVTRFESFRACPFKHFAQYGLSLKERAVFRLQAPDLGQFLHAALKAFGDRMQRAGRAWGSFADPEYSEHCAQIVNELAPKLQNEILLSSGQHKHLLGRLQRTIERSVRRLAEFDRVSSFKPLAFEQNFGRGEHALPPLVYPLADGYRLELAGQIDRIDQAEYNGRRYILIIDYKSGGAWLKLVDVYYGLKLQLLTYLLVVQKAAGDLSGLAECLPAGVLYYFVKNPSVASTVKLSAEQIERAINQQLKMPGWVLADQEVVRLLDTAMDSKSDFLKIALKKDNSFYSSCLAYVKSSEEFSLLLEHIEAVLAETGRQILSGEIAIDPCALKSYQACSYCRYLPVCQFDRLLPENDFRKLADMADDIVIQALTRKEDKA
ncbi:helicase-exonuclease AddAB subunit AddB|uniref:ATP-dependent helicase/deoxyribonuclease subunit B n=1 Tax=Dendrosporobacter quercicolus TaxID=146817 RepID=A0A1G9Z3N4_9FIRM|nr:helicase-exonuclease AddAB subunit AddB [Dendrosporobacter quercicolus]NSL48967.1 helicase-exonuclease AddAB subunit AddB [Dendrosporobacter quercicolus DSM 1736]SDN16068.1 DNA helicase/exodeoxyribonuclease V, subunit B [Dendrosporobacter quercicolus]